jgi:hypothetical protein
MPKRFTGMPINNSQPFAQYCTTEVIILLARALSNEPIIRKKGKAMIRLARKVTST